MATSLTVGGLDEALVRKLKLRAVWLPVPGPGAAADGNDRLSRHPERYASGYSAPAVPARS